MSRLMYTFLRWAALMALLLSPLAMQPVAAASTTAMAASAPGHCEDQAPAHGKAKSGDCAMGCASALPAVTLTRHVERRQSPSFTPPVRITSLAGRCLDIEIPPPRG